MGCCKQCKGTFALGHVLLLVQEAAMGLSQPCSFLSSSAKLRVDMFYYWWRRRQWGVATSAKEHLHLDMFYYWCRRRQWGVATVLIYMSVWGLSQPCSFLSCSAKLRVMSWCSQGHLAYSLTKCCVLAVHVANIIFALPDIFLWVATVHKKNAIEQFRSVAVIWISCNWFGWLRRTGV